jgi:hypothetical protein
MFSASGIRSGWTGCSSASRLRPQGGQKAAQASRFSARRRSAFAHAVPPCSLLPTHIPHLNGSPWESCAEHYIHKFKAGVPWRFEGHLICPAAPYIDAARYLVWQQFWQAAAIRSTREADIGDVDTPNLDAKQRLMLAADDGSVPPKGDVHRAEPGCARGRARSRHFSRRRRLVCPGYFSRPVFAQCCATSPSANPATRL